MENKNKTKKKFNNYMSDEDIESYKFGSENQSPKKKRLTQKKNFVKFQ